MSAAKRNPLPLKIAAPLPRTQVPPDAERRFLGIAEPPQDNLPPGRRWKDSKLRRDIVNTERLQVYIPPALADRLRLCGAKERRSQSDIVTTALEGYLASGSREDGEP